MRILLTRLAVMGLGALYGAQGLGKMLDLPGYIAALGAFHIPDALAWPLGVIWASFELLTGLLLWRFGRGCCPSDARARMAGSASLLLALLYTALNGGAQLAGLAVANCTCFGTYFPQALGLSVLAQDAVVILWALFVFRATRGASGRALT